MCLFSKIIKSAISLHPTVGVFQQIFYILYPSNCHECFSIKNHLCEMRWHSWRIRWLGQLSWVRIRHLSRGDNEPLEDQGVIL